VSFIKAVADELCMTLADFDGRRIVNDKKLLFDGKIIKQEKDRIKTGNRTDSREPTITV